MSIYPVDKHCALRPGVWPGEAARGVEDIARDCVDCFDPAELWPMHPLDGDRSLDTGMYMGAGGVFWAISHLSRQGLVPEPAGWFDERLAALVARNAEDQMQIAADYHASASYLFGSRCGCCSTCTARTTHCWT